MYMYTKPRVSTFSYILIFDNIPVIKAKRTHTDESQTQGKKKKKPLKQPNPVPYEAHNESNKTQKRVQLHVKAR